MVPDRILVIEDDPDVRDTVCSALEALFPKATITALGDGDEFLRIFDERAPWEWQLIVLDCMLPTLSGPEIIQRVRACRGGEDIPILGMTGYDTPEMEEKIRRAGANQYMAKPFEMSEFRRLVKSILSLTALLFALALAAPRPARAWVWTDQESSVLPSLQEEFDQEVAAYRSQQEKGMTIQERVIALERLTSTYKPQGIDTLVLESERDRLIVQADKERLRSESVQKVSSELFQLALQKTKEGRFEDALLAIQRAERLVPGDKSISEIRRKLEGVTSIVPNAMQAVKSDLLIRKGIVRYLENDGPKALNALRYANEVGSPQAAVIRLVKLIEKEFPATEAPSLSPGETLVDYKLQLSLEYVYDGQYLKSANECNEVLDLEPSNVLALTRLGSAYFAMGQKTQARDIWSRALTLDPGNQVLRKFVAEKFPSGR